MAQRITNTTKNSNLFYQLYSKPSDLASSGFTCVNAVDEADTSFDITNGEAQITDSNGDILSSLSLADIHSDGIQEYYNETKILGPQSAYLLQGNVLGETYAAQFFPIMKEIQEKEGYESYVNIEFDIHYTDCDIHAIHINSKLLRTEPGSVCELIQKKLDELKIPVSISIRTLPIGSCDLPDYCADCSQEIDYLCFQSSKEGYSFYVHSVLIQIIDIDYMNYDKSWADYSESPFIGANIDFDYIIDLLKTKKPRKINNIDNPDYKTVPCDLYKYMINIAPLSIDDPAAFKHNIQALIEFSQCFDEYGNIKDDMKTKFVFISHMYPDIYAYYWGDNYSILNKYNINDIIEVLNEIAEYVADKNVHGRPQILIEDIDKRIYNQKYMNGASRGILIIPDWPSEADDYSVLKLAHVPDYINKLEKIEIPEHMHIEGFQCSTCVDAFIKVKAPVKINTLIQTEYEIYKKGFCNMPIRKVTSNEQLATCVDNIWTDELHPPITNNDLWTNSPEYSDASDVWSDSPQTHMEHHMNHRKEVIDGIDEFNKDQYAFMNNVPGHHHHDKGPHQEYICGLYGYMGYLNENDLWTRVGEAYMVIGAKDNYQSKVKNLLNSVLIYNPNDIPIRIKFMVFS